jgi:predicted nucleic acid-binding Zn ribbon protein
MPNCTLCGAETTRVFTPPAIHFKGPGFYKTGG